MGSSPVNRDIVVCHSLPEIWVWAREQTSKFKGLVLGGIEADFSIVQFLCSIFRDLQVTQSCIAPPLENQNSLQLANQFSNLISSSMNFGNIYQNWFKHARRWLNVSQLMGNVWQYVWQHWANLICLCFVVCTHCCKLHETLNTLNNN